MEKHTQRNKILGSCGGVMFVVIGALVVLSVLGAVISRLTGSGGGTEIQENRFDGAYYAAYSGLEYLQYAEQNLDLSYADLSDFVSKINAASPYTLPSGVGQFQIVIAPVAGSTTKYTVASLIGSTVGGSSATRESSFVLKYLGERTFASSQPSPNRASKYVTFAPAAKMSIDGASDIIGDIYAKSLKSKMVVIDGSVTVVDDADLNFKTIVNGKLCSGGDVSLDQSSVSGDINVQGNVIMKFASSVGGSAFVGGSYSSDGDVVISGDLNVGKLTCGATEFGFSNEYSGDVFSAGNIKFSGSSSTVLQNAYSGDTITLSWGSTIKKVAVAKIVKKNEGSVGSMIETTSYPPNIAPKEPAACTIVESPHPNGTVTAGTVDISSGWAQGKYKRSTPLAPGNYRKLSIANSEPLTLRAGQYVFAKMNLEWNVTLNLDVSAGDITIFSIGPVNTSKLDVYVTTDGSTWKSMRAVDKTNAAKVYLEAHDNIVLGWDADWFGTLFSTKVIRFDGSNDLIGAVAMLGTQSDYSWANNIDYVPSNYAMAHWYD